MVVTIVKMFLLFLSTHALSWVKPFNKNKTSEAIVEVAALNLADLILTLVAIFCLGAREANPLMAWVLEHSIFHFCALKIMVSAFLYSQKDYTLSKFSTFGISFDQAVYRTVIAWNTLTLFEKLIERLVA